MLADFCMDLAMQGACALHGGQPAAVSCSCALWTHTGRYDVHQWMVVLIVPHRKLRQHSYLLLI